MPIRGLHLYRALDCLYRCRRRYCALLDTVKSTGGVSAAIEKESNEFVKRYLNVYEQKKWTKTPMHAYNIQKMELVYRLTKELTADLDTAIGKLEKVVDARIIQDKKKRQNAALAQKWDNLEKLYKDYETTRCTLLRTTSAVVPPDPDGVMHKRFDELKRKCLAYQNGHRESSYHDLSEAIDVLSTILSTFNDQMKRAISEWDPRERIARLDASFSAVSTLYNEYANAMKRLTARELGENDKLQIRYEKTKGELDNYKMQLNPIGYNYLSEQIELLAQNLSQALRQIAAEQKLHDSSMRLGRLREQLKHAYNEFEAEIKKRKGRGQCSSILSEISKTIATLDAMMKDYEGSRADLSKDERRMIELRRSIDEQCRVAQGLLKGTENKLMEIRKEIAFQRRDAADNGLVNLMLQLWLARDELNALAKRFENYDVNKHSSYLRRVSETTARVRDLHMKVTKLHEEEDDAPSVLLDGKTDEVLRLIDAEANEVRQLTEEIKSECNAAKKQPLLNAFQKLETLDQQLTEIRDEFETVTASLKDYDTDKRDFLLKAARQVEDDTEKLRQEFANTEFWSNETRAREMLRSLETQCDMAKKWGQEMKRENMAIQSLRDNLHGSFLDLQTLDRKLHTALISFKILRKELNSGDTQKIMFHLNEISQTREKIQVLLEEYQENDFWDHKLRMENLLRRVTKETEQAQKWIGVIEGRIEMPSNIELTTNSTQASSTPSTQESSRKSAFDLLAQGRGRVLTFRVDECGDFVQQTNGGVTRKISLAQNANGKRILS